MSTIEAPHETASTQEEPQDTGLFDAAKYDTPELRLPKIEGEHGVDAIEVGFSGTIKLDRGNPADVELFRKLKLGQDVSVNVVAVCTEKKQRPAIDEDGYVTEYVSSAKVKVANVTR